MAGCGSPDVTLDLGLQQRVLRCCWLLRSARAAVDNSQLSTSIVAIARVLSTIRPVVRVLDLVRLMYCLPCAVFHCV